MNKKIFFICVLSLIILTFCTKSVIAILEQNNYLLGVNNSSSSVKWNNLKLRGTMVSTYITKDDLKILGKDGNANVIRWPLGSNYNRDVKYSGLFTDNYEQAMEEELKRLDAMLPYCKEYGLYVVLDFHDLSKRVTESQWAADRFIKTWKFIAEKYKDDKAIIAYDIANEPEGEASAWNTIAENTAKAIRAIDPDKTIIIEPVNLGTIEGLGKLKPVDVSGVVYSIHMYLPYEFTHQGIDLPVNMPYPGNYYGYYWNKDLLRLVFKPVLDFQKKYGVEIYIGEFSAVRYAPGNSAYLYLKDVIELFEEYSWNWTYHAFRQADIWSLELGNDYYNKTPVAGGTDRLNLIRSYFLKNIKPSFN